MTSGDGQAKRSVADDPAGRLKVFISYSRKDVNIADELELALIDKGFEALVDRHDIDAGEEWRKRLRELIFSCDTVVFVLTETSAASPICAWEVEEAERLGKRRLVVAPGPVPSSVVPPPQLAGINWIHCWRNPDVPGSSFVRGVLDLERALKVDLAWLREQTRLTEQAMLWQARAKSSGRREDSAADFSMLLRGKVLGEALAWARRAPTGMGAPPLVAEYLEASQVHEALLRAEAEAGLAEREAALKAAKKAQRGLRVFGLVTLVVGLALSAAAIAGGWFAAQNYVSSSETRSALFAREANALFDEGDYAKAMLMALYGDPAAQAGFVERSLRPAGFEKGISALVRAYARNRVDRFYIGHVDAVSSIALSPDEQRFLTGSIDGTAKLWRIGEAEALATFSHEHTVTSVAFHPDGERLLTGSDDGTVRLWRIGETDALAAFPGHDQAVRSFAFHPDGERYLTGSDDGTAKLWSPGETKPLEFFYGHKEAVTSVAFSANGDLVLTGSDDGTAKLWQIGRGESALQTIDPNQVPDVLLEIESAKFGKNDEVLLSTAFNVYRAPSWKTGELTSIIDLSDNPGKLMTFSSDGTWALVADFNGAVKQVSERSNGPSFEVRGHGDRVSSLIFHPDGERFLTRSNDGTMEVWRIGEYKPLGTVSGLEGVSLFVFHPDGERILIGLDDGMVVLLRIGEDKPLRTFLWHEDAVSSIALHPDGERFLTGSDDGAVALWEIGKDKPLATFSGHENAVSSIAFHPDGERFLTGSDDGTAKLWRVEKDNPLVTLRAHKEGVATVAFVPGGDRFITAGDSSFNSPGDSYYWYDGAKLWRIDQATPAATFIDGEHPLAVSFNRGIVLARSKNVSAGLWPVGGGLPLVTFEPDSSRFLESVAFSLDGKKVLIGYDDGMIRLWAIPDILFESPRQQVRMACASLKEIGATEFAELDYQRFPILDRNAPHPCAKVWATNTNR